MEQIPSNSPKDPTTTLAEAAAAGDGTIKIPLPVVYPLSALAPTYRLEVGIEPDVEYMRVDDTAAIGTGTLSVTRAAEDASEHPAQDWPAGTPVRLTLTHGALEQILSESIAGEATARNTAIGVETTARASADTAEATTRAAADTALGTAIGLKQNAAAGLTDIAGLTPSSNNFIVGSGTNWIQRTSAQVIAILQAAAWVFAQAVQFAGGSAAAVAIRFSATTNTGIWGSASQVVVSILGTSRLIVNGSGVSVTGSVTPTGAVNSGLGDSGALLTLSATSPQVIEITSATAGIILTQTSWGRSNSPTIRVRDTRGLITAGAQLTAFDDLAGAFNSINEIQSATGLPNPNGVWSDQSGSDGPAGNAFALTKGHEYEIMNLRNNPGVAGAIGGYSVKDLGPCMV